MSDVTRRELLGAAALTAAGAALPAVAGAQPAKPGSGRLKQSVCRWCYNKIPLADFFIIGAVASIVLWVEEARKLTVRHRSARRSAA